MVSQKQGLSPVSSCFFFRILSLGDKCFDSFCGGNKMNGNDTIHVGFLVLAKAYWKCGHGTIDVAHPVALY